MTNQIAQNRKTVLITGCSPGGIGYALAEEFHARGLAVIATARRPEVLEALGDKGMTTLALDVTNAESIANCKQQVSALTGGRLDILVNNAGKTHTIPATDINLDEVRHTYETNVFGVMAMVQAFVPLLVNARGHIVMISSVSSVSPYVFGAVYASSKAALNGYSRTLRQELRPFGVRVTVSMTGTVRSRIASYDPARGGAAPGNVDRMPQLPRDSLYSRIKDAFEWRLKFSQQNGTVDTSVFARQLVAEVLRGEGWFGRLLGGARKWFWAGGLAWQIWFARALFGEWLLDEVSYRRFGLHKLEAIVSREGTKKAD